MRTEMEMKMFGFHNIQICSDYTPQRVIHRQRGIIPGCRPAPKDPTWHRPSTAQRYYEAIDEYIHGMITYTDLRNAMTVMPRSN